jgi:hypothetical protein
MVEYPRPPNSSRRDAWFWCVLTALVAPGVLALLSAELLHGDWGLRVLSGVLSGAAVLSGPLALLFLPVRMWIRLVGAVIYLPCSVALVFVVGVTYSCGVHGACL